MFITELMKQRMICIRSLHKVTTVAEDDRTVTIDVNDNAVDIPIATGLGKAIKWLLNQESLASLIDFRNEMSNKDTVGAILQSKEFITGNILTLGVYCEEDRQLLELQYSNTGNSLPNPERPEWLTDDCLITLSRLAFLRREDDLLTFSMPLKDKRFIIFDKVLQSLFFELGFGTDLNTIERLFSDNESLQRGLKCILYILANEGFVVAGNRQDKRLPTRLEEGDEAMQQWDFPDIINLSNSRLGFNFGLSFGGAFPFVNLIKPLPAIKPIPEGRRIPLYKPDLDSLIKSDASLSAIITRRCSIRHYDEESPISLNQIGEFLFRTGRTLFTSSMEVTNAKHPERKTMMELAWRPYPTGGGSYELELYLTVDRADGLEAGIYYYSPRTHELVMLGPQSQVTEALIHTAYVSCAQIVRPQVLIHIAARFQRVSWKYHNIAYATSLRNTGVLYQTFYLNAIAMGIAPCALGSGSTALFSMATNNQPHIECNVGEFMLGSLPSGSDLSQVNLELQAQLHNAKLLSSAK